MYGIGNIVDNTVITMYCARWALDLNMVITSKGV